MKKRPTKILLKSMYDFLGKVECSKTILNAVTVNAMSTLVFNAGLGRSNRMSTNG